MMQNKDNENMTEYTQNPNHDELFAILRDTYDRNIEVNTALERIRNLGAKTDLEPSENLATEQTNTNEPKMGAAAADEDDEVESRRPISRRGPSRKTVGSEATDKNTPKVAKDNDDS